MRLIGRCRFPVSFFVILLAAFWANSLVAQMHGNSECCQDRWDPAKSERHHWGSGHMGRGHHQRMQRHWSYMHQGIPSGYRGARNPVSATTVNVNAGAKIYQQQCAQCHGASGMGDGDVGKTLNPSPALLAHMVQRPGSVDGYLLWSISEGGKRFDTGMPAFIGKLNRDNIWKVILYMRSGFPNPKK